MSRRPKHYDRPGKRPGPPRTPHGGGSIIDQRARLASLDMADAVLDYFSIPQSRFTEEERADVGDFLLREAAKRFASEK